MPSTIKWKNDITRILKVKYPIIQAPMFGVTTPEMVAAAVHAGAVGSLPVADLPAEKCVELIRRTRQLAKQPFAVNLFLHPLPKQDEQLKIRYNKTKEFLQKFSFEHNFKVEFPEYYEIQLTDYHDQVETLIAEDCKIVSFTFGVPDSISIEKFKRNGTILIGTATSLEEAIFLEEIGIDIICIQGYEAGGHRGSFLGNKIPKIGGISLLAQAYDKVGGPLIYGGGIYDAKTLLATKLLGAQGFQIGTLLLCSEESSLHDFEKEKLRNSTEKDVVLTKSFSGRYARGLKNFSSIRHIKIRSPDHFEKQQNNNEILNS